MLAARKRAGLRQIELAVALGERYDHSVISAVEHNRSSLRTDGLTRAAHALGVSTDYLLGLADDPTPSAELRDQLDKQSPKAQLINDLESTKTMLGERLAESRKGAGLTQFQLAIALGDRYDRTMIGHVEHNRSGLLADGLVKAAGTLHVSVDYLLGLTDDPTPAAERDPKVLPFPGPDDEYESVRRYNAEDLRLAAGVRAFIDREPTPSEVRFRKDWLRSHALAAKNLMLLNVIGDSMFPTIEEGDSVLIDESRRAPRSGRVYGLRTLDGPLVKRLRKRQGRWWADSDNGEYKPRMMREDDQTLGQVVWWAHTEE